jgi:hypothetical protein
MFSTNASYSALISSFTTASGFPLYVKLGVPTFKKQVTGKHLTRLSQRVLTRRTMVEKAVPQPPTLGPWNCFPSAWGKVIRNRMPLPTNIDRDRFAAWSASRSSGAIWNSFWGAVRTAAKDILHPR